MEKRCPKTRTETESESDEKVCANSCPVTPTTPVAQVAGGSRVTAGPSTPTSAGGGGSFMAGHMVVSNFILDEVLNEKKMKLLQSPDVIRFLQEKQGKT